MKLKLYCIAQECECSGVFHFHSTSGHISEVPAPEDFAALCMAWCLHKQSGMASGYRHCIHMIQTSPEETAQHVSTFPSILAVPGHRHIIEASLALEYMFQLRIVPPVLLCLCSRAVSSQRHPLLGFAFLFNTWILGHDIQFVNAMQSTASVKPLYLEPNSFHTANSILCSSFAVFLHEEEHAYLRNF